jgi:prepilin peptidase CpaA
MITSTGALILLVPVLPLAIWAAANDLKHMKIPNKAVMALAAVWPLLGWMAVATWTAWFWGFALMAIVLVAGYLLYTGGGFGAGDAKYAAAMAPIFVGADIAWLLLLIAGCLIGALIVHRIMRSIPPVRRTGKAGRKSAIFHLDLQCRELWSSILLPPSGRKSDTSRV